MPQYLLLCTPKTTKKSEYRFKEIGKFSILLLTYTETLIGASPIIVVVQVFFCFTIFFEFND